MQTIGGAIQVAGGALLTFATGGWGGVAGVPIMLSGLDDLWHAFSGGESWKSQAGQYVAKNIGGVTDEATLRRVGMLTDMVGGLFGTAGASAGFKALSILCKYGRGTAEIGRQAAKAFGREFAFDAAGSGVGAGVGYAMTDSLDGALRGATYGTIAVGAARSAYSLTHFQCFPAGTPVATALGSQAIERIAAGDFAWAFDLKTARWEMRQVVEVYEFDYEGDFVALVIDGREVESTFHHPYWVCQGDDLAGRPTPDHVQLATPACSAVPGRWVDAGDLRVGDAVLLQDGRRTPITALRLRHARETVYNLQVQELHNYAVGEQHVLAHNMASCSPKTKTADTLPSGIGGTRSNYDKRRGQGLYVLRDEMDEIVYVGRGDAPARIATHANTPGLTHLSAEILWTNNLTKAQAKGLEQRLIDFLGGSRSQNAQTSLLNEIRSISPRNRNASRYRTAASDALFDATLERLGL